MASRARAQSFGEWFHEALLAEYTLERETWALEQARRIEWKLNRARRGKRKLGVEVLWFNHMGAFTAPGRWVYISRRLLERCSSDAPAALALGHEMAHQDLGHLDAARVWVERVPKVGWARMIGAYFRLLEARWVSHQSELAADARGLELCVRAGYDKSECLDLFDLLTQHSLDYGDIDGVYGPEEPDETTSGVERWFLQSSSWVAARLRPHPPLHERRAALEALKTKRAKTKLREIKR